MKRVLPALLVLLTALVLPAAPAQATGVVEIRVLSNRADLVSAGDALVEVVLPPGTSARGLRVEVAGRDVSASFARRSAGTVAGRVVGLVSGLPNGRSVLTATLPDGRGARLTVTNHPRGGPVFSGPQVQPFVCTTEANGMGKPQDRQCDGNTVYRYQYKNRVTGQFTAYDPANPPPDDAVARTTTDEGRTVRYVVRIEQGTLNRAIYDVAVLIDPAQQPAGQPPEAVRPWTTLPGWNRKLGYSFGGGCAPGHSQAGPESPLLDMFLKRGFAVAVSSLNVNGNACNATVSAETVMMVKERVVEQYGEIRYTIGNGCSGGAEAQNSLADNYPGLLDGIRPECTFADLWTPAINAKSDCALLENYWQRTSPQLWPVEQQRAAVLGNSSESYCLEMQGLGSAPEDWDPTTGCKIAAADQYDPASRRGARCTLPDYNVAMLGRRSDGFANGVLDDVGVQWGLAALRSGAITPDQFVDLNEKVGGWTIDHQPQSQRTLGDVAGIARMYRNGQLSYGRNLAATPTIDARTTNLVDFHENVERDIVRARQQRSTGDLRNQVYWYEPQQSAFGLPSPMLAERTLVAMDAWLAAIEADHATGFPADKAARNKPADVQDQQCFVGGQPVDFSACAPAYPQQDLPRIVSGGPRTSDVLKCRLKPLDRADYPAALGDAQFARLRQAFPTGVCDYAQPGVGEQPPTGYWLDFAAGPDGVPLGAPPHSVPFGPLPGAAAAGTSDRGGTPAGSVAGAPTGRLATTGPAVLPSGIAAALLLLGLGLGRQRRRHRGGATGR